MIDFAPDSAAIAATKTDYSVVIPVLFLALPLL